MKKIMAITLCMLVFLSGFSMISAASSEMENLKQQNDLSNTSSDDVEYYALIIGVEIFEGVEYPDETFIDEDALKMYDILANSLNWDEENIKLLLNEDATKDNIHDAITVWLDEREDKNDVVLIFFSDHGWRMPLKNRLQGNAYVFTYNVTHWSFDDTKISDKELDSWIDVLESKNIAIFLEHCFSGRMLHLRQHGRVVLTAGGRFLSCPVDEDDDLESGIWSFFIFQGFDVVADINNDGWITAEEVFRYARKPTFWFSFWKQFPFTEYLIKEGIFVGPQIPFIYDRHIGQIPLIQYRLVVE